MVQFVKMQADILHEHSSQPVTVTVMRGFYRKYDHFDMAEAVDFVSIESNVPLKTKITELACDIDMLRSLKKTEINAPDGDCCFWAMEQKVGSGDMQDVKSGAAVRPRCYPVVHLSIDFPRLQRRPLFSLAAAPHRP